MGTMWGIGAALLTGVLAAGSASPAHHPVVGRELTGLVGLVAERILIGDKVAAAKFGTTAPIEDPVREQAVLDQAAALAVENGIDARETVAFFRAQIEASKVVQRGLFDRWTAHPEQAPTERPDLATEVRPQLDRITIEFIGQLAATEDVRGPGARCAVSLAFAAISADHRYHLDALHESALREAVRPVCAPAASGNS
ncbi:MULTISPECIES: gamma subclass chorismate mutase AroQ [Catenuloplanes]|uniref:chorismate mutase n=1 Tax=Catenuloplanes niger TaxID=587534 RepID=A0AAE3ZP95_9ACTN|nr:gamma subclass chorismate mutase AroQ [Catenuloplanes niger]MDR7322404.1 chorismate mutase [Catenuloplanes niger]